MNAQTQVTPELRPYVEIINGQIKTTSLKVAEHFNKQHKNVLRAIENLECSPEFTRLNFELCHKNNELQNDKPQPYYEMTRDGFTFLAMGFTGKQAAKWKESYINAFNAMAEQAHQAQYGLKQLPEPPTISKSQQGVLFNKVTDIAAGRGQIRTQLWSRFQNHFKLNSYKNLPADQFDEALAYLKAKQDEYSNGVEMLYVSNVELDALVFERIKTLEGELLDKDPDQFMTDSNYRNEAREAINAHLDACHAEMAKAGLKTPAWPTISEQTITGLASSLLWQSRWLLSFHPDNMKPQLTPLSPNDCVVDSSNPERIKSFINRLDMDKLHDVTDAVFNRVSGQINRSTNNRNPKP